MISPSRDALVILFIYLCAQLTKGATDFQNLLAIWRKYNGQLQDANSSYYGYYQGGGACSFDPLTTDYSHLGWLKVAAGDGGFQKSLGCGMCVEIKGQGILADLARRGKISKTPIIGPIYAVVIDRCGNCNQGFDLYAPGADVWKTQFRAVDCPRAPGINGNIKFRFVESNPWALKLQTRNSRVVTVGLEILQNGRWICLQRTDDNYFLMGSPNRVQFPLRVRLTSVSGEQVETIITELENDKDITSSVQFLGFMKGSDPRTIRCHGQGQVLDSQNIQQTMEESFCKGKKDGTYSDPDQCTTYYQCTSGYAVRRHCPTGQVFNDILKACDSPADFPCHQRTVVNTPSPTLATEKDKGGSSQKMNDSFCDGKFDGFYQDPNECQAFYQCLRGKASKRYCLKGMVFNPTLKTCDTPDNFPCRVIEGSEPSALETKRPEVIPDPRQGEQSTPGNAIGSSTSDPATRTGSNSTKSPNPIENKSEEPHVVDKAFCLDRANGNYRDPYDCSSFYTCAHGETMKQSCPRALKYNYNSGECDWPSNVKCIRQPLFKAWIRNAKTGAPSNEDLVIHGSITRVTAVARQHINHKPDDEIIIVSENDNRKK